MSPMLVWISSCGPVMAGLAGGGAGAFCARAAPKVSKGPAAARVMIRMSLGPPAATLTGNEKAGRLSSPGFRFSRRGEGLVHAHRCELILHRGAISRGIGIGIAQHAAVKGMEDIELHAGGQVDILRQQAETVGLVAVRGLDIGDAG